MNNKSDFKRIITLVIIGVLAYLVLSNFAFIVGILSKLFKALFPFILGIILAFILNILMTKVEKGLKTLQKKLEIKFPTRGLSIAISLIIFILAITFIALELIPELVSNLENLIKSIPGIFKSVEIYILSLLSDYPEIQKQISDLFTNTTNFNSILVSLLNYIINSSISFVTSFVNSIITIFTSLVFAIYMLSQKESLINGTKNLMKAYLSTDKTNKILEIGRLSNQTFAKFVSGQCLEALILGCIFFVILTIFRFPYALLISVISCITALVPIFGSFIAVVIGTILIATVNPLQSLIFAIIFLVVQQIEGNLIYPKVVGKSVGLSPIWTLLAISVGGSLFGIVGMLVGLPLASIIYALIKKDIAIKLKNNKKNESA